MEPHKLIHILFVDDDTDESYLFKEALEHAQIDIKVSSARDGNDLLDQLANNPLPDLVLLDINMPYKDGIEALTEVRNNPAYDQLPVVIYSTAKDKAFIDKCYQKGASFYVVKPNDFEGIVEAVKVICGSNWNRSVKTTEDQFVWQSSDQQLDLTITEGQL